MPKADANTKFEAMMQQMRRGFLQELPERLDGIEQSLLALEQQFSAEGYNDLFGSVHSLKGSGGTFGLQGISAICHALEDYLGTWPSDQTRLDPSLLGYALRFVDLMRTLQEEATANDGAAPDIEARLAALKVTVCSVPLRALMVVNSSVVRVMCVNVLQQADIELTEVADGMQALQRALAQPYDLVLASAELSGLNGEALIAALRLSGDAGQKKPFTILIRSGAQNVLQRRHCDPDVVLCRNAQFLPELAKVIAQMPRVGGG